MEHMRTKAKEVRKEIGKVVLDMVKNDREKLYKKHCIQFDTKVWLMIMGAITTEIELVISQAGMSAEDKIHTTNDFYNAMEFIHDSVLGTDL